MLIQPDAHCRVILTYANVTTILVSPAFRFGNPVPPTIQHLTKKTQKPICPTKYFVYFHCSETHLITIIKSQGHTSVAIKHWPLDYSIQVYIFAFVCHHFKFPHIRMKKGLQYPLVVQFTDFYLTNNNDVLFRFIMQEKTVRLEIDTIYVNAFLSLWISDITHQYRHRILWISQLTANTTYKSI